MEYRKDPEAVKGDIECKLKDVVNASIITSLVIACKQFKKKPKIARVATSPDICTYCQSHTGTFSVDEFEQSKARHLHKGCRCKTIVSWKEGKHTKVEHEARKLLISAKHAEPTITNLLKRITPDSASLVGLKYKIKSQESLERKLLTICRELKKSPHLISGQLKDVLRYTYVLNSETFARDFFEVRELLELYGYNMINVKNTLKISRTSYRGVNTFISSPYGQIFEVQFHTPESLDIKEKIHRTYEEYRLLDKSSKQAMALEKEMIKISSRIKTPKGIEKVRL